MPNHTLTKAMSAYAAANSMVPPLIAVARLYERAMTHLHMAREAARAGWFEDHFRGVERAITIMAALDSVLDMEKGGEVAQVLRRFYRILMVQAGLAAARKDPVAATDAVIRQLEPMAKAWQSIAAQRGPLSTAAERGGVSDASGARAKGSHTAAVGRPNDHEHGGATRAAWRV
ncbi:flagellar export chaperone FliS [Azospirillum sp. ST 5-10]|uniref:flagellar export chaperone FliS n=1 Tax=unclassified Azospirillum TaxID=2630922 RepID=UPI003F49BDBC